MTNICKQTIGKFNVNSEVRAMNRHILTMEIKTIYTLNWSRCAKTLEADFVLLSLILDQGTFWEKDRQEKSLDWVQILFIVSFAFPSCIGIRHQSTHIKLSVSNSCSFFSMPSPYFLSLICLCVFNTLMSNLQVLVRQKSRKTYLWVHRSKISSLLTSAFWYSHR